MSAACEHETFFVDTKVARVRDGGGIVTTYLAELKIRCSDCGMKMQFAGMPAGLTLVDEPRCSADGFEARLVIRPMPNPASIFLAQI